MAGVSVLSMAAIAQRPQLRAAMYGARDSEDIDPLRVAVEAGEEAGLGRDDILPAKKFLAGLEEQQQPLTFLHVTRAEIEHLRAVTSRDEVVTLLAKCFDLALNGGSASEILLEYHYHNYAFCQRSRFSVEQTSTFLSLMAVLHSRSIAEGKLPEDQARTLFEAMLSRHSQQLPPYSFEVFPPAAATKVKEYVDASFFRHYRMYAYAYVSRAELSVQAKPARATAVVTPAVPFRLQHEVVDESEIEELLRSLDGGGDAAPRGPPSRAGANATMGMGFVRRAREDSNSPSGYRNKSNEAADADHDLITNAIEAAMADRLGSDALDERLKLPGE